MEFAHLYSKWMMMVLFNDERTYTERDDMELKMESRVIKKRLIVSNFLKRKTSSLSITKTDIFNIAMKL